MSEVITLFFISLIYLLMIILFFIFYPEYIEDDSWYVGYGYTVNLERYEDEDEE